MSNFSVAIAAAFIAAAPASGAELTREPAAPAQPCKLDRLVNSRVGVTSRQEYLAHCPGTQATTLAVSFEQDDVVPTPAPSPAQSSPTRPRTLPKP